MTQIKKTLSIAGIIALVTAPAMAEIASTAYVQNIVNNIPKPAAATASSAGLTKLYSDVGTNTDGTMTQKAIKTEIDTITNALNSKLSNNTTAENSLAIGNGAQTNSQYALAIGSGAQASEGSIQLGPGTNNQSMTFKVALTYMEDGGENDDGSHSFYPSVSNYTLLGSDGKIPEERFPDSMLEKLSNFDSVYVSPYDGSISVGGRVNSYYGIAIGGTVAAYSDGDDVYPTTIQLGNGTNSTAGTFNVYLSDGTTGGNYTLLDASGKIPAERLSGGMLTNAATGSTLLAIGNNVRQSGINNGGIVIGDGAALWGGDGESDSPGDDSIAIGTGAEAGSSQGVAIAIGPGASASAWDRQFSMAIGYGATAGENAIQLGTGNNSNENTFQVFGTTLLNDDGIVPATALAPEISSNCKAAVGQKCALVVTWDGSKYSQSWEVVRSTSSGQ